MIDAKELKRQNRLLLKLIPAWRDEERRKRESSWLVAYLLGNGFSYYEALNITDARQVFMVYQAMLWTLGGSRQQRLRRGSGGKSSPHDLRR